MTKVGKIQTDTTYSVEMDGNGYTVTVSENYGSPEVQWEIFDSESNEVTNAEVIEHIVHVIEAFMSESALRMCQCSTSN